MNDANDAYVLDINLFQIWEIGSTKAVSHPPTHHARVNNGQDQNIEGHCNIVFYLNLREICYTGS